MFSIRPPIHRIVLDRSTKNLCRHTPVNSKAESKQRFNSTCLILSSGLVQSLVDLIVRLTTHCFVLVFPDFCDGIHLHSLGCHTETVFLKGMLKLVDAEQNVIMAWDAKCQGGDGRCVACDTASAVTLKKVLLMVWKRANKHCRHARSM